MNLNNLVLIRQIRILEAALGFMDTLVLLIKLFVDDYECKSFSLNAVYNFQNKCD